MELMLMKTSGRKKTSATSSWHFLKRLIRSVRVNLGQSKPQLIRGESVQPPEALKKCPRDLNVHSDQHVLKGLMSDITFSLCSQDISKSAAHVVHQHVLKIGEPSLSQFLTVDVNQSQNASVFQSGNKTVRRFAAEKANISKFIVVSSMMNPRPVLVVNRQSDFIFQLLRTRFSGLYYSSERSL
jgi:hypothetical protein